jgi:hypothetical protein
MLHVATKSRWQSPTLAFCSLHDTEGDVKAEDSSQMHNDATDRGFENNGKSRDKRDWLEDDSYSVCILKFPYMWRNIISCSWSRRRSQEWYSLMEQFSTLSWFLELVRGQCLRNEKSSPSDLSRKEDVRAKISLSFHSDSPFDRFHFHRGLALSI